VRRQRFQDAGDRDAAGLTEIGSAENRHVRGSAGILDQIADAHDVADDADRGLERRPAGLAVRLVQCGERIVSRRECRRYGPLRGGRKRERDET
jgi:hypothetical protein